jgi:ACS family hexuronate transporter-like MFS transporter
MPRSLRDTGAGLVSASTVLGALAAPILIVPLAVHLGWRAAFLIPASVGLLWLPCWIALAWRPAANLGPAPVQFTSGSDEPPRRLRWQSPALWATMLIIFFTMPSTIFINNFLAHYRDRTYALTQSELGWVLWQPFLTADLGQLAGGLGVFCLLRRDWTFLAARRLVIATGLLGATAVVAANSATEAHSAIAWLSLSRFCFTAAHSAFVAYGIESVTDAQTGLITGMMNAAFSVSSIVFSPLIGWLADRYGYHVVILVVAASPLVGLGCWGVLTGLCVRPHSSRD